MNISVANHDLYVILFPGGMCNPSAKWLIVKAADYYQCKRGEVPISELTIYSEESSLIAAQKAMHDFNEVAGWKQ